ncbi:MFS transporter [Rhodovibrionaceae bacterium A322]
MEPAPKAVAPAARQTRALWDRWLTGLAYGLPGLAVSFPVIPLTVYLPAYYARDLGLGFATVGIVLFLSRLVDAVSDPVVGYYCDRWRRKPGGRQLWIVLGALICGGALYALAQGTEAVTAWYLGGWTALLYVGWTMIMVPYLALGADISCSYEDNTWLAGFREGFSLLGILLAVSLPLLLTDFTFARIPDVVLPLGAVTLALFLLGMRGKSSRFEAASPHSAGVGTAVIRRSDFTQALSFAMTRRLLLAWFFTAMASAVPAAVLPLFSSQVLGGGMEEQGQAIFVYFSFTVLGMPFWSFYAKGRLKQRVMARGMIVVCLAFGGAAFLSEGMQGIFLVICAITGFALAAELMLAPSMLADLAMLYKIRKGQDATAIHFALWGVTSKIAFALAVLLSFLLLEAAEQFLSGQPYLWAVGFVYALLPTLLKIPAIVLIRKLPFGRAESDLIDQARRKEFSDA